MLTLLALCGCDTSRSANFSGKTMGTTYHITVVAPFFSSSDRLQQKVEQRLQRINQSLSTYINDSEISRFNAMEESGVFFQPSADFEAMLNLGRELFELTDGAWDATIFPLVKLWGFDRPGPPTHLPDPAAIEQALACVGFEKIDFTAGKGVYKHRPCLTLDFASIAKGYGVDQLTHLLKEQGLDNFIVEIGGDLYAAGTRKDGRKWRIGINQPEPGATVDLVRQTGALSDRALATSGDYRHFFTLNGRTYCHVLDPASGYPITSGVVSASVTATDCAMADGLATALMVLPVDQGLALINSLDETECLIIVRQPDGSFRDYYSDHFFTQGDNNECV